MFCTAIQRFVWSCALNPRFLKTSDMAIIIIVIWIALFFHVRARVISNVTNLEELKKGFCHQERKTVRVSFGCDIYKATVTVETYENMFAQCSNTSNGVFCSPRTYMYNESNGILEFNFTFDYSQHAGKSMWINYTCDIENNETEFSESLPLRPCLSGFIAYATHNDTHVNIVCKHADFNMSQGISIVDNSTGNHLMTCQWNQKLKLPQCHPQSKGLSTGIDGFITEYKAGSGFICTMDGQSIGVDLHANTDIQSTAKTVFQSAENGGGYLVSYILHIFPHLCVAVFVQYTVINV
ncbi:uncharacterized protein LOC125661095 isoform X2 [Ostrea edulis]|uniref:uncharacterized protein LOC125661095 isoform X2 n=1 Tax=Ostrea edulis TaxID=37623 RepID=UPI0024AF2063|nr:uncharacterized protein LOC125661095 isoform X2 [Ostrea edulis]